MSSRLASFCTVLNIREMSRECIKTKVIIMLNFHQSISVAWISLLRYDEHNSLARAHFVVGCGCWTHPDR